MGFRAFGGLFVVLSTWSAYLQLNDPDPARWVARYLSAGLIAALDALGRPQPWLSLFLAVAAGLWAASIAPALFPHWHPNDLTATMNEARPEIELGRELFGLLIVAAYGVSSHLHGRRRDALPA
jgi:hypothetical protein